MYDQEPSAPEPESLDSKTRSTSDIDIEKKNNNKQ